MNSAFLFSYAIDPDGTCSMIDEDNAVKRVESDALAWVHLDASQNTDQTEKWLNAHVSYLDPIILKAFLAENTRPRIEQIGDGALIILRGVNMNEDSDPEDMVSLRMWIDPHRIITVQKRPLKTISDLAEKMETTKSVKDSGDFLSQISLRLFQIMEPFVGALSDKLDDLEEQLSEDFRRLKRSEITDIRVQAILFRRYFSPQKDVMAALRISELPWLSNTHKRHIQENLDRITRYIEDLDAVRERAQIIKDELANAQAERLNNNLYVLSIISAIFLPLGFLTGLLGINVGGMPGADNPETSWIVCAACVGLGGIQYGILRLAKWL